MTILDSNCIYKKMKSEKTFYKHNMKYQAWNVLKLETIAIFLCCTKRIAWG